MIIILMTLFVILLLAISFVLGYYIGKGNITIKKRLTKAEKDVLKRSELESKELMNKFNDSLSEILQYNDDLIN